MKKAAIILTTLVLLVTNCILVSAEQNNQNNNNVDGVNVVGWIAGESNDTGINRPQDWNKDINVPEPGSQVVEVELAAHAYIPCYIRMDVNGNTGKATAESFGPGAKAKVAASNERMLVFDNEIGGFCNKDWNPIATGRNAEIAPGDNVYLRGCDTFKVVVYANDNYQYVVLGCPLEKVDAVKNASDPNLVVEMRSKYDETNNWNQSFMFATKDATTTAVQKNACETLTAYHQFRVPYKKTTAQGEYKGAIVFKAYLI